MLNPRSCVVAGMVLAAAASRLLPHPPNFTPIGAMALFGGAYFARKRIAFAVPLAAMFLSDLVLAATHYGWRIFGLTPYVYGSFALITGLGLLLRRRMPAAAVGTAAPLASLLLFAITNFAFWLHGGLYPHTFEGLATCYVTAIPFFGYTVAGDLVYSFVLFGGFALAEWTWKPLRLPAQVTST
jgi:hypothetical protein